MTSSRTWLRVASVAVALLSVCVAVAGWLVIEGVDRLARTGLTSTETFETLDRTVEVSIGTLDTVQRGLTDLEDLVDTVASSSETTAVFVRDVAEVTSVRIPRSLDAIESAMPGLIEAGRVIDDTLSTLSLLGVDYRPEIGFDDALREVDASLEGLSEDVAAQGSTLRLLAPEMEDVGGTALDLSDRIAETRDHIEAAEAVLATYGSILADAEASIGTDAAPLGYTPVARVLLVAIGLLGVGLGTAGWKLGESLTDDGMSPVREG